jgi:hypothetical protein
MEQEDNLRNRRQKDNNMTCQLTYIDEIKRKNSWINNALQTRVKILRPAKRKAIFLKNKLFHILLRKGKTGNTVILDQPTINPGDRVKVRSRKEIRNMLDDYEKYKGCLFIDEMYEHCGNTYNVLKTANYFFDEAKQKICKTKDTVILEGVVCSGRQRLYQVSCDRNCFFFWHKDWLGKVDKKK